MTRDSDRTTKALDQDEIQRWAMQYANAFANHEPYVNIGQSHTQTTISDAYQIQKQFVDSLVNDQHEAIAGYKAALTAPQAQAAMAIDRAVIGVLFASGQQANNATLKPNKPSLLEVEIGFKVGAKITEPVDVSQVFKNIISCHPMLEIAAPNLTHKPTGADLIAANSAAYAFIEGSPLEDSVWQYLSTAAGNQLLDDTDITLQCDGKILLGGKIGDVLGGQAQALTWLINQVLEQGYKIDAGQIFMTGSIGGMAPAKAGTYQASYQSARADSLEPSIHAQVVVEIA